MFTCTFSLLFKSLGVCFLFLAMERSLADISLRDLQEVETQYSFMGIS